MQKLIVKIWKVVSMCGGTVATLSNDDVKVILIPIAIPNPLPISVNIYITISKIIMHI